MAGTIAVVIDYPDAPPPRPQARDSGLTQTREFRDL
jgi:hypothetical protein